MYSPSRLARSPNPSPRVMFPAIRLAVEYRFMNPTTQTCPVSAATCASTSASAAVAAGGFSMNTGNPACIASAANSECCRGPTAIPIASTSPEAISAAPSLYRRVTPYRSPMTAKRPASTSAIAANRTGNRTSCGNNISPACVPHPIHPILSVCALRDAGFTPAPHAKNRATTPPNAPDRHPRHAPAAATVPTARSTDHPSAGTAPA